MQRTSILFGMTPTLFNKITEIWGESTSQHPKWNQIWYSYVCWLKELERVHLLMVRFPLIWLPYSILAGGIVGYLRELLATHFNNPAILYIENKSDCKLICSQDLEEHQLHTTSAYAVTVRRRKQFTYEIPGGRSSKLLRLHFENWESHFSNEAYAALNDLKCELLIRETKESTFLQEKERIRVILKDNPSLKIHPDQHGFGLDEIIYAVLVNVLYRESVVNYKNCNGKLKYLKKLFQTNSFSELQNAL